MWVQATDRTVKYSIAVVQQDFVDDATRRTALWLLFDVDGNGDYDAGTDMVIFLAGNSLLRHGLRFRCWRC